jgi:hypothetical protein
LANIIDQNINAAMLRKTIINPFLNSKLIGGINATAPCRSASIAYGGNRGGPRRLVNIGAFDNGALPRQQLGNRLAIASGINRPANTGDQRHLARKIKHYMLHLHPNF